VTRAIPHLFADASARLEDLHAIAIEGQRSDNARDMEQALIGQLRSGIAALDTSMRYMAKVLDGDRR
jgi:hypothetical protein